MTVEAAGIGALAVVLAMALVTLATRWGGLFVMSFVPIGGRVKRFIEAMSGSVLVALLAPLALNGDAAARIALLTTAVVVVVSKRPLPAITCGVLAAALVRQL